MVKLVLNFATAGPVALTVPVEPQAYDFATYSPPAIPAPTATATPTATRHATTSPSASGQPVGYAVAGRGQARRSVRKKDLFIYRTDRVLVSQAADSNL